MDSTPVNWEALDALIVEFAKSENLLIENNDSSLSPPPSPSSSSLSPPPSSSPSPSPSSSPSSSSYQSRLLIRRIRRLLESGDIDSALNLLRLHAPSILNDHRLLFCLQKQKFIELLRRGTPEDRDSAIECVRTSLAPCALDAYPEAYEEFKHIILALIYDKNDGNSPVANEMFVIDIREKMTNDGHSMMSLKDVPFQLWKRMISLCCKPLHLNQLNILLGKKKQLRTISQELIEGVGERALSRVDFARNTG